MRSRARPSVFLLVYSGGPIVGADTLLGAESRSGSPVAGSDVRVGEASRTA